jgi:isopenicillin N synthase-like dioxygenase
MRLYTPPKPAEDIPVVDLAGSFSADRAAQRAIAWEIHRACRETGFFYIRNHSVPDDLVAGQFAWARRLFDLPLSDKLALHMKHSPTRAGYEPIGGQVLDSQEDGSEPGPADLKESFYIGVETTDGLLLDREHIGFGHNQWPASLPGFREQMLAYQAAMRTVADHLLGVIALSLDLPEAYFASLFDEPARTVRLIKYPPQPSDARTNQLGAGAHTDWGGITVLAQDDIGGLEVQNVAGDWIEAPPIPGTFVVNLGDLMARWTNDLYRSNLHRVKNNDRQGRDRYSVPFFYSPRRLARIECLPTCNSAEHPPKYAPVTTAEHMDEMFRKSYGYV